MANSNVLIAFVIIISCKLKKLFLNKSSLENYEGIFAISIFVILIDYTWNVKRLIS